MIVTPGMHKSLTPELHKTLTRNLNKPYMNCRNHETKWRPEHSRYQIEGRRVFKLTASTIRNTLKQRLWNFNFIIKIWSVLINPALPHISSCYIACYILTTANFAILYLVEVDITNFLHSGVCTCSAYNIGKVKDRNGSTAKTASWTH